MFDLGCDSARIWLMIGILFVFGFLYNAFTAWLERESYDEGYTAILVVAGTGVTLLVYGLMIDFHGAMRMFLAFAASGFWMVVGSTWRAMRARRRAQDLAREHEV